MTCNHCILYIADFALTAQVMYRWATQLESLPLCCSATGNHSCIKNMFFCVFLARSTNLLEGLYILRMFFLYFLYIFLMVDFLTPRPSSSESNGLIFTNISGVVEGCKGLFTLLSFFFILKGRCHGNQLKLELGARISAPGQLRPRLSAPPATPVASAGECKCNAAIEPMKRAPTHQVSNEFVREQTDDDVGCECDEMTSNERETNEWMGRGAGSSVTRHLANECWIISRATTATSNTLPTDIRRGVSKATTDRPKLGRIKCRIGSKTKN